LQIENFGYGFNKLRHEKGHLFRENNACRVPTRVQASVFIELIALESLVEVPAAQIRLWGQGMARKYSRPKDLNCTPDHRKPTSLSRSQFFDCIRPEVVYLSF
jgi:hypothetical protein